MEGEGESQNEAPRKRQIYWMVDVLHVLDAAAPGQKTVAASIK